jgi:hypothetical protein
MLKIFFLIYFCGFCRAFPSESLKVHIDGGQVIGRYLTSESGRPVRSFMGIPFAAPPIGKLRFRARVKPKPWNGALYAQKEPPMRTQRDPFTGTDKIEGQEDCLYLNVYAPQVIFPIFLSDLQLFLLNFYRYR